MKNTNPDLSVINSVFILVFFVVVVFNVYYPIETFNPFLLGKFDTLNAEFLS